ncbi:MAG: hypothetical protein M1821_005786 [Bathelium mastoideum]|nr:MAG: hypothetical protein M1821_005786 [Bathelium mastoideum]
MATGVFTALLWVVEEFGVAFQCHAPETWNSIGNVCFERASFWYAVGAFNIITNLCLIILPAYIVKDTQMSTAKKMVVLTCFGSRITDVAVIGAQLAYTSSFNSSDPSLSLWPWVLITQLEQCVTLITSCVPYLKPLLEAFSSGMYGSDELRRRGLTSASASTSKGSARADRTPASSYVLKDVSGSNLHASGSSAAKSDSWWGSGTRSSVGTGADGAAEGRRGLSSSVLKAETVRKLTAFSGSGKGARVETRVDGAGRTRGTSEEALVGEGTEGGIMKSFRVDVESNIEGGERSAGPSSEDHERDRGR